MSTRISNAQIMEAINAMSTRFDDIESRLTALETAKQSTTTQKKTKSSSKKSAPRSSKKNSSKKSEGFDRSLYEATAKKLGVFNTKYGKVVSTVKDGKIIATAKQNREKVYKAMGLN